MQQCGGARKHKWRIVIVPTRWNIVHFIHCAHRKGRRMNLKWRHVHFTNWGIHPCIIYNIMGKASEERDAWHHHCMHDHAEKYHDTWNDRYKWPTLETAMTALKLHAACNELPPSNDETTIKDLATGRSSVNEIKPDHYGILNIVAERAMVLIKETMGKWFWFGWMLCARARSVTCHHAICSCPSKNLHTNIPNTTTQHVYYKL